MKKKQKNKDFGCLPWVGYLLESHAVELLKKVHMELSPFDVFSFKKITCWIYQYNGIYIFFFFCLFFVLFFLVFGDSVHTWFNSNVKAMHLRSENPATQTVTWSTLGRDSTKIEKTRKYLKKKLYTYTLIHPYIHNNLKRNK